MTEKMTRKISWLTGTVMTVLTVVFALLPNISASSTPDTATVAASRVESAEAATVATRRGAAPVIRENSSGDSFEFMTGGAPPACIVAAGWRPLIAFFTSDGIIPGAEVPFKWPVLQLSRAVRAGPVRA